VTLIANAINWDGSDSRIDQAYEECVKRLDRMQEELSAPLDGLVSEMQDRTLPQFESNTTADQYRQSVAKIKEEILAGEAFQVVLSQRFSVDVQAEPIDVYRMLRLHNPSPYMYLFQFNDGVSVVGSSPEALVKVNQKEVMVHPIAGTRKRSASPELDAKLAEELLADPKERAEMLEKGGVLKVGITWNCNYDLSESCLPKYSFSRFDLPFTVASAASGFNFR
jgi:anthranilate synthase component 1